MEAVHAAAEAWSKLGFRVFPVKANAKTPATAHGVSDATTDPAQIREWFGNGRAYNLGVRLGDHLLIDVDVRPKKGIDGTELFAELSEREAIPEGAYEQNTPSGGIHVVAALPHGTVLPNQSGELGPGLEFKTGNQYFVASPSRIGDGVYSPIGNGDPGVLVPEGLLERLLKPTKAAATAQDGDESRHKQARSAIMRIARETVPAVGQLIDEGRGGEVERLVKGAVEKVCGEQEDEAPADSRWKPLDLRAIAAGEITEPDWIVTGFVAHGEATTLTASGGGLKTTIATQVGIDVAAGRPALGEWPVPKPLRVLFVSEDMPRSTTERKLQRLIQGSDLTPEEFELVVSNLDVRPQVGLDLGDPGMAARWASTLADGYDLVVIDSRVALQTGSLNDAADRRTFYREHLAPVLADGKTGLVVLTHPPLAHKDDPTNQRRESGSVDGRNQSDRTFYLDGFDETRDEKEWTVRVVLRADKMREGASLPDQVVTCSGLSHEPLRVRCDGPMDEADRVTPTRRCGEYLLRLLREHPEHRLYVPDVKATVQAERFDKRNHYEPAVTWLVSQGDVHKPGPVAGSGKRGFWLRLKTGAE